MTTVNMTVRTCK